MRKDSTSPIAPRQWPRVCPCSENAGRRAAGAARWSAVLLGLAATFILCGNVQAAEEPKAMVREIYVPFSDINVLLENQPRRVLLSREEYEDLVKKAKKSPDSPAPQGAVLMAADYSAKVEEDRARWTGTLAIDVLDDGVQAIPLELSGVGVRSALLDGKPASIGRASDGRLTLFVEGKGRRRLVLEMVSPLETTAAQQVLTFRLPQPAAAKYKLTMPGDVEIKSGAAVVARTVDDAARETRFELAPQPGGASLLMTLNSRLKRHERAVVARSVLVDELTQAYERLHAAVSLSILHQAVDRFRFVVPEGFEITQVSSPLLARWAIEPEGDRRVLDVRLREQTVEPVVLNLSATRSRPALEKWSFPRLEALDVVGQVAVVGLLLEERLDAEAVEAKGLIPIDTTVLARAMPVTATQPEPGTPPLRAVVAYYAPQGPFDLAARFARPPAEMDAQTNVLLVLGEQGQQVRGGFMLTPRVEKLFALDFSVPAGWHVTGVTGPDNKPLPHERFGAADQPGRIQVRLPQGVPPGQDCRVLFQATRTPSGWLGDWETTKAEFPVFAVAGTTRDVGAVAIDARDDMTVRPEKLQGLVPLDEKEKEKYALGGVASSLAYRYEGQPYQASLVIQRTRPRLTARTFTFVRTESDALAAHYEIAFTVEEARTRQVVFSLPESTPAALDIKPLDDVKIKEFGSRVEQGRRHWTVLLEEPRQGSVRLTADFQQPLPAERSGGFALPAVRAENVAYQSGLVSVEGSAELDVQVETKARKVDVGELVDAAYQPGRRLLGVFGFIGQPEPVTVKVVRPKGFGIYPAIVQRAALNTNLAIAGVSQTEAVFNLRTKALYLEIVLPEGSELWSAFVDEKPVKPQKEKGRLLVSLAAAPLDRVRALKIWYQTPVAGVGMTGTIDLPAPTLALRADQNAPSVEVPLADLVWNLRLPNGYRVIRSKGTVTTPVEPPEPAAWTALKAACGMAAFSPARSLRSPYYLSDDARYSPAVREDARAKPRSRAEPAKTAAAPAGAAGSRRQGGLELQNDEQMFEDPLAPAAKEPATAEREATEDRPKDKPKSAPARDKSEPEAKPEAPMAEKPADKPAEKPPALTPPTATPPAVTAPKPGKDSDWDVTAGDVPQQAKKPMKLKSRLEGLSSLKMSLVAAPDRGAETVTFQSLGVQPRLTVTVADHRRFDALGWALVLAVLVYGLAITRRPAWTKTRWILLVIVAGTVLPLIPGLDALTAPLNMAVFAAAALAPYYLLAGLARLAFAGAKRVPDAIRRRRAARAAARAAKSAATAAMLLFALWVLGAAAWAQGPPAVAGKDGRFIIEVADPPVPVNVPDDAVLLPYDPESNTGIRDAGKMLVPYAKYVELWNRAYPDKKLELKAPPAPFGLAGASYTTTLEGGDYLEISGRLEIDILAEGMVTVPLGLAGGVLSRAELDGKPARLSLVQPEGPPVANPAAPNPPTAQQAAQPMPQQQAGAAPVPADRPVVLVYVAGKGRHQLDLTMRLKLERRGGWRVVEGAVPAAPASALAIVVPQGQTEVRLAQVPDRKNYDLEAAGQRIETALGPAGSLGIQWRPKVGEGQVDRSLTARSSAVLDVQEDGLRLYWQLVPEFRRSQRDAFRVYVPGEYLVEKVEGSNIRGWEVRKEDKRQVVEVSLLKTAKDSEQFALRLWRAGAVGQGDLAEFEAPVIALADAAMHQGTITIRRSPLLDLRTAGRSGVAQAELSAAAPGAAGTEDSPLGIRPYEAYQFTAVPFSLRLTAAAVPGAATAETQMLLRISEHERQMEAQVKLTVRDRPAHRVEIFLPEGLKLDHVTAPGDHQWALSRLDKRPLLTVYLAAGRVGDFSVVLSGKLAREEKPGEVPLPRLEVRNVQRQEGDIAVQADPGYAAAAVDLQGCELDLAARVQRWMKPEQFAAVVPLAIRYRAPDYRGTIRLTARTPIVSSTTITNLRVTDRALEETVFLDFTISQAGVRQVAFLLPAEMKDARIRAPMLRQKTVEPAGKEPGSPVRVRLEFQDEVSGKLRVVVENDRLLTDGPHPAPVPVVQTGATDQQFIALESAGRDEVVVATMTGVDRLGLDQAEAVSLKLVLGDKITQAYVVRGRQPLFAVKTQRREAQEFAGARIGLGETVLVVDASGAYRGQQTYRVANTTEQFLDIELPDEARLWTVHVAGEPVKPTVVPPGGNDRLVRIPLIKTAAGDLDYPVVLKYGGTMPRPSFLRGLRFPLVRTASIKVERSNVELYLPEDRRWFDFGGTLGQRVSQEDVVAGRFSYERKQAQRLLETLRGGDDFARARAHNNLKNLGTVLITDGSSSLSLGDSRNEQVRLELRQNAGVQQEVQQELQKREQSAPEQTELYFDNRKRLNDAYEGQQLSRSKNVVQDLGRNFDAALERKPDGKEQAADFNDAWLNKNALENPVAGTPATPQPSPDAAKKSMSTKGKGQKLPEGDRFRGPGIGQEQGGEGEKREQGQGQGRGGDPNQRRSGRGTSSRSGEMSNERDQAMQLDDQRNVVQRYQQRLEQQTLQQPALGMYGNAVHTPGATAPQGGQMGGFGAMPANQPAGMPGMPGGTPPGMMPGAGAPARYDAGGIAGGGGARQPAAPAGPGEPTRAPPPAPPVPAQPPTTGLASIDVEIPRRGQTFYFTTPGGDIDLTARSVAGRFLVGLGRVAGLVIVLAVVLAVVRAVRRGKFAWVGGRRASTTMVLIGGLMTLAGLCVPGLLLAGLVLLLAGVAVKLRRLQDEPASPAVS